MGFRSISALATTALLATTVVAVVPSAAVAQVTPPEIVVNTTFDPDSDDADDSDGVCEATSGGGDCTVGAAIAEAGSQSSEGEEQVTVRIPAGTYVFDFGAYVYGNVRIVGDGVGVTVLRHFGGGFEFEPNGSPLLEVEAFSAVEVTDLTLEGVEQFGGAVRVTGDYYEPEATTLLLDGVDVVGETEYQSGGAISAEYATVEVVDSTIVGSTSDVGGAIWASDTALTLTDTTVQGVAGAFGGGIALEYSSLQMEGGAIHDSEVHGLCECSPQGAGMRLQGSSATLTDVDVHDNVNQAVTYAEGGGIYVDEESSLVLDRSVVRDNISEFGGGVFVAGFSSDFEGCEICMVYLGSLWATNTTFSGNIGQSLGGGIANEGDVDLTHVTIADNYGAGGGGGYACLDTDSCVASVYASVIVDNDEGAIELPSGARNCLDLDVSDGEGNFVGDDCSGYVAQAEDATGSESQAALEPLNTNGGTTFSHLPFGTNSVLVDALTPEPGEIGPDTCRAETDQRGVLRPDNGLCDIGAIEFQTPTIELGELSATVATVPAGGAVIPLDDVPAADLAGTGLNPEEGDEGGGLAAAPIGKIDLDDAPVGVEASPLSSIPLSSIPLSSIPLSSIPLSSIPLSSIPLSSIGGWDAVVEGSTLEGLPIQTITLQKIYDDPVSAANLAALPLSSIELEASPLSSIPLSSIALGALPLSSIPLSSIDTGSGVPPDQQALEQWCAELDSVPGATCADLSIVPSDPSSAADVTLVGLALAGVPLSSIPLSSIPLSSIVLEGAPLSSIPLSSIPLSSIAIEATPLSSIPLSSIPLSSIPLSSIGVAATPLSSIPLSSIPLSSIPLSSIPLSSIQVEGAPLSSIPLSSIEIRNSPLSSIPLSSIVLVEDVVECSGWGVDCTEGGDDLARAFDWGAIKDGAEVAALEGAATTILLQAILDAFAGSIDPATTLFDLIANDLGDLTLGDLAGMLQMSQTDLADLLGVAPEAFDDITLGDVLLGLVPPTEYPWEELDDTLTSFSAYGTPVPFELTLEASDTIAATDTQVTIYLPDGVSYVDGSASMTGSGVVTDAREVNFEGPVGLVIDLTLLPGLGQATLSFSLTVSSLEGGSTSFDGDVWVPIIDTIEPISGSIELEEPFEPNDVVADATPVVSSTLYVSPLSSTEDVDVYRVTVPEGARLSAILSDLPADYDLTLYGPKPVALRGEPTRSIVPSNDPPIDVIAQESPDAQVDGSVPLEDLVVLETSANRGLSDERIDAAPASVGGDHYLRVTGHDGATSLDPYALRVKIRGASGGAACAAPALPFAGQGTAGPADDVPVDADTVVLLNHRRLDDAYGTGSATSVLTAIAGIDGVAGVTTAVVSVDNAAAVQAAMAAWDADRCNPDAANAVVSAIGVVLDGVLATAPGIENVVIIGADEQLPMARLVDVTKVANEKGYAGTLARSGTTSNDLVTALAEGHYLSDDVYGASRSIAVGDRELFVPQLALGRLVETPSEIVGALENFVTYAGRLDAGTTSDALAVGYEFLSDGTEAVAAGLEADARRDVERLISESWTAQQVVDLLTVNPRQIASINGHADDSNLLPADGNATHNEDDLLTSAELAAAPMDGSIIFSMGCHAGLSVSDVQIGAPRPDFAQTMAGSGAVYAAGTGYQYGDTEVVAYTEQLMANFADGLDGTLSVGAALTVAKQDFVLDLAQLTPYDEKALQTVTFYGLPMYRVGPEDVAAPPGPQPRPTSVDPITGLVTAPFAVTPANSGPVTSPTGRGQYWTADDGVVVSQLNPLQPRMILDVGQPDREATGALITALMTEDVAGAVDPVIARSIVDQASNETEPEVGEVFFPARFQNVTTVETREGLLQQMVLTTGQFLGTGEGGTQRLLTDIDGVVLYAPESSTDRTKPVVLSLDVVTDEGVATLTANVVDDVAVGRVIALVVDPDGDQPWTWELVELEQGEDGRWTGGTTTSGDRLLTYLQAADTSGNVGVFSDKGEFDRSSVAPPPVETGVTMSPSVAADPAGWTNSTVTITLEGVNPEETFRYSIAGGPLTDYTAPFTLVTDGRREVVVEGSLGSEARRAFRLDLGPPTVTVASPAEGEVVPFGASVTPVFSCRDAGAGTDTCTGPTSIDTTTPGPASFDVVGTDRLGKSTTTTRSFVVGASPNDAPTVAATPPEPTQVDTPAVITLDVDDETPATVEVQVDWGDGDVEVFPPGTTEPSHVYDANGLYEVSVLVTDDGGLTAETTIPELVVFDPTVGKVHGGGQFLFDAGAGEEKMKFAFDAHYKVKEGKKGADPTVQRKGGMALRLKDADLEVYAGSFDWMVQDGDNATMAGLALISGHDRPGTYRIEMTEDPDETARIIVHDADGALVIDTGVMDESRKKDKVKVHVH